MTSFARENQISLSPLNSSSNASFQITRLCILSPVEYKRAIGTRILTINILTLSYSTLDMSTNNTSSEPSYVSFTGAYWRRGL
jgi:hypothetical protein